jgi:spore germination protein KC
MSLAGCYSTHEIKGMAIIMGVGIDEGTAPGKHLVTVQIAKASALKSSGGESGGSGDGGTAYVMTREEDNTISSAIQDITYQVSRDLYFSHNQIIVIGRAVAERDITESIDFFVRDYEGRLNTRIVIADGRAEDILVEETELEKLPAVQLSSMLDLQRLTSSCASLTLREFLISTLSKTTAPVVPIVELYQTKEGKMKARIGNTAVFKAGKLVGELDKAQMRGVLWITGKIQSGALDVDALDGKISFDLLEASSSIEPNLKDGRFSVKVRVRQSLSVAQTDTSESIMKPENADKMNAAAQEAITKVLKSSIDQAKALGADVFGFGEAIQRKYPNQSKRLLDNWDSEFPKLEVDVTVTATVRNTGSLTDPIMPGGKP